MQHLQEYRESTDTEMQRMQNEINTVWAEYKSSIAEMRGTVQDVLHLVKNECDELDETLSAEGKMLRHLQRALQDKDAEISQLRSQLKYGARVDSAVFAAFKTQEFSSARQRGV